MKIKTWFFSFLCVCISAPLFSLQSSGEISHSIMSLLENLEDHPPEKYSQKTKTIIKESLKKKNEKIRIVSYNILFNLFDNKLKDKSFSWVERCASVVTSIENMNPDILCVQEAYPSQLLDLQESLKKKFSSFVGVSISGELNAVFYKKDRFVIDRDIYRIENLDLTSTSMQLPINPIDDSIVMKIPHFLPTDLEPGKQLTLAHFRDRLTEKNFTVINTHLTYHRMNSREDQANFIAKLITGLHALRKRVVLAGDFNTFPNHPDKSDLPFYDGNLICQIFQRALNDTREVALLGHIGPISTGLQDFFQRGNTPFENSKDSDVILDHIFTSPEICVFINATEPCLINDRFPSDHMPVIADILLL